MDELKASPVTNPRAEALARALRAVRGVGNKVDVPYLGPAGDFMLGQAPEEVENWAYGNSPLAMPPSGTGGYVPVVKTNRKEGMADALSMIPFGGGGASQAGTLPFKQRNKTKLINDWVSNGVWPYNNIGSYNTVPTMETLTQKADKLGAPQNLYRYAHGDKELEQLSGLKPGDVYSPNRLTSMTREEEHLDEIEDAFTLSKGRGRRIHVNAPVGSRIGGDLGRGNEDYYNEFLVRPGASFEVLSADPDKLRMRALNDSEANLHKLRARLKALRGDD